MSQPGYQTITIHILLSISRIKGNQTMKLGRNITGEIFFFNNYAKNGAGRLVTELFLFL